jgi:hypothetical protein
MIDSDVIESPLLDVSISSGYLELPAGPGLGVIDDITRGRG